MLSKMNFTGMFDKFSLKKSAYKYFTSVRFYS